MLTKANGRVKMDGRAGSNGKNRSKFSNKDILVFFNDMIIWLLRLFDVPRNNARSITDWHTLKYTVFATLNVSI